MKTGIGGGDPYDEKGKHGRAKKAALYILLTVCMVPFVALMGYMGYESYHMFEGLNTGIVLGITCYAGVFLAFFSGMTMCVGVFYNSSDTEFLLPMPFKAEQIVGAKFATMYLYTMITDILFIMPIFAGYGIAGSMGADYWIIAFVTAAVIPVTPLVYGGLFAMLLLRIFRKARNKDFITVVTSIFAMIMAIGINAFTSRMGSEADSGAMASVIMDKGSSIMEVMNNIFPNTVFAEKAVSNENVLMLLLFILSAAAFVALFIIVAKLVYIKTVVEMSASNSKNKKLTDSELKKAVRRNSQVKAYVLKELKLVFRTPIYFMNCAMLTILWPVIIAVPMIAQMLGGDDGAAAGAAQTETSLFDMVTSDAELTGGICMLAAFAITMLAVSFCMMNTTTISREGKNVIFMKYIPMSYKKQLQAKALPGIIITLITGTVYSIAGMALAVFVFDIDIPVPAIVLSVIISILACIAFNLIDMVTDIIKPKLEWQTEQAAVKQNMIAIIPMFVTMIAGVAIGAGAVMLKLKLGMPVYALAGMAVVLLAVLSVVFYITDVKLANKYFARY